VETVWKSLLGLLAVTAMNPLDPTVFAIVVFTAGKLYFRRSHPQLRLNLQWPVDSFSMQWGEIGVLVCFWRESSKHSLSLLDIPVKLSFSGMKMKFDLSSANADSGTWPMH
jgi:hypothetical protein